MLAFLTLMSAPAERVAFEPYRACIVQTLKTAADAQVIPEDFRSSLVEACEQEREDFRTRYLDDLAAAARHSDVQEMDRRIQAEIDDFLNRALDAYLRYDQTGLWPPGWP